MKFKELQENIKELSEDIHDEYDRGYRDGYKSAVEDLDSSYKEDKV